MFTGIIEEMGVVKAVDKTLQGSGVTIIPHTAKVTTLGIKQTGDAVNLETDLIGRYVERLLPGGGPSEVKIDRDYLQKRVLISPRLS